MASFGLNIVRKGTRFRLTHNDAMSAVSPMSERTTLELGYCLGSHNTG